MSRGVVEWLFLAVPWGCLQFVIVVFPDYTQLLFLVALRFVGARASRVFICVLPIALGWVEGHVPVSFPDL